MGTETGNFHVVTKQVRVAGAFIDGSGEELLLVIETRAPREIRADLEILASAMTDHVGRMNAFGGLGVVSATRGVNVVIPGPPTHERGIDPPGDFESRAGISLRHRDGLGSGERLRAAREDDREFALWQLDALRVPSI